MNKPQRRAHGRPVRALLLSDSAWIRGAMEDRLAGLGCEVQRAWSLQHAVDTVRRNDTDLLVVEEGSTVNRTFQIRESAGSGRPSAAIPVVFVALDNVSRDEELALLRGGVWDVWAQPLDGDAFDARLRNYLSARNQLVDIQDSAFVDEITLLYTRRGLETRVAELAAQCARQGTLLSCVAFSLCAADSVSRSVQLDDEKLGVLGAELLRVGRGSDTIGRADEHEFVVLAPGASGGDARQLAHRITRSAIALLNAHGVECDAPWVGRVLQPSRDAMKLGEELLSDTLLALQEVTAEHEIPASI